MRPITEKSFELEGQIQHCWCVVDDLDTLIEGVMEKDLTQDEIANILIGIKGLYHLKFEKAFQTFEELHRLACATR